MFKFQHIKNDVNVSVFALVSTREQKAMQLYGMTERRNTFQLQLKSQNTT